jgi:hypothetical protein
MSRRIVIVPLLAAVLAVWFFSTSLSCSRQARVVWQQQFDTGSGGFGSSVACDGRDIIVGTTIYDTAGGRHPVWQLRRYDRNGRLNWHRAYRRGRDDSLADVAVTADHDIVATGWTGRLGTNLLPQLLLVRFSAHGEVKWEKEYRFDRFTRGMAVRLDTIGRIWVCGSMSPISVIRIAPEAKYRQPPVEGCTDMFVARFDSLGNLLDSAVADFGGDETAEDLLLVPSHFRSRGGFFLAGIRTPLPGRPDTLRTKDIVVVSLDQDLKENWRWLYDSGDEDIAVRLSWQDLNLCAAVTSRRDSAVATELVEYSTDGCYHGVEQETRYPGASSARCAALVRDRSGAVLGLGTSGAPPTGRLLGWRYFRKQFTDFLTAGKYRSCASDRANDVAVDADGNVIVTGTSNSGRKSSVLVLKVALPRHKPPPGIWLPNMHR